MRKNWLKLIALAVTAVGMVILLHGASKPFGYLQPLHSLLSFNNTPPPLSPPRSQLSRRQPPAPAVVTPTVAPRVDGKRLFSQVQDLAFVRSTAAERQQARQYILRELKATGWSPTLQYFSQGANVVAQRPGTNPKAGKIIVAAHFDTIPGSPGADDNATGVATVLEVARLLANRPTARTLQLVLFDQEERMALGSYAFTDKAANLTDLQGVIVVEMVGFTCQEPGCQRQPQGLPITPPSDRGDFLAVVGDAEHLPLLKVFEQATQPDLPALLPLAVPLRGVLTPDLLRSDHAPFWYQGIGAVMVTDTADFRNPHYHRASDVPETLDPAFLQGAAQLVVNATTRLLQEQTSLQTPPTS